MFALIFSFFFKNSFQQRLKVNWPSYNTYVVRGFYIANSQLHEFWVNQMKSDRSNKNTNRYLWN